MKKSLFIFILIFPFLSFMDSSGNKSEIQSTQERAIQKNSIHYDIPASLFRGIRWAESMNGILTNNGWIASDSYDVLIQQEWVINYPNRESLFERYGRKIYYCIGELQVGYLTARSYGFRGSPRELNIIETNYKYGGMILKHYLDRYKNHPKGIKRAIASYNNGWPEINSRGDYINQEYVDKVYRIFTNQYVGGWNNEIQN